MIIKEINKKIDLIIYMSVIFCYKNNHSFASEINKINFFDLTKSQNTKYLIPYVNENRKKIQKLIVKYYKIDENISLFINSQYEHYEKIYADLKKENWEINKATGHATKPEKITMKEIPSDFSNINQSYNSAFNLLK